MDVSQCNGNLINGLCDAEPLLAGFRILTSPVYVGNNILDKERENFFVKMRIRLIVYI